MAKTPILQGFVGLLGKRFTLAFGKPITIAAKRAGHHVRWDSRDRRRRKNPAKSKNQFLKNYWVGPTGGLKRTGLERGRRRTRQDQISPKPSGKWAVGPMKLRTTFRIRTERRKPVSSAGPAFGRSKLPRMTIQPFDLMSRRHPLSSTWAALQSASQGSKRSDGSCDVPASNRRHFFRRSYFFFFATLRVFFAVFFTALFAFFAFFAFLAILPSDMWDGLIAACTRESRCTTSRIHQHTEKNSFWLKEVLTHRSEPTRRTMIVAAQRCARINAKHRREIPIQFQKNAKSRCTVVFLLFALSMMIAW
jgi:hypothetical protein